MRHQDQLTSVSRPIGTAARMALLGGLLAAALVACSSGAASQPGGPTQTPASGGGGSPTQGGGGGGGGGGGSLADRANAVKDVCTLMPADLAAKLVPGGSAPQSAPFPPSCTVTNGTQTLQITVGAYDAVDALDPAEVVPGLGVTAYMQVQFVDDAYLKIVLTQDHGAIYVEDAGHDGKDHKADAISVGQYVLAHLP